MTPASKKPAQEQTFAIPLQCVEGSNRRQLRCRLRSIRIDRRIDAKAALPPGAVAEGQYNVFQRLLQQHAATIKGDAQLGSPATEAAAALPSTGDGAG